MKECINQFIENFPTRMPVWHGMWDQGSAFLGGIRDQDWHEIWDQGSICFWGSGIKILALGSGSHSHEMFWDHRSEIWIRDQIFGKKTTSQVKK